jgi:uncharacterized membrane protein
MTIKGNLVAGVLVWVPIVVTIAVVQFVLGLFTEISRWLPVAYQPETWLGWTFPGFNVIVVCLFVWMTGVLASNVMGRWVLKYSEKILARIPLVRSVYQSVKQAMSAIFEDSPQRFRQVVLVQYPREGIWSLGFITNQGLAQCANEAGEQVFSVFIPTTPNPTSGFIIMVPEKDVKIIDLNIDAALKYIFSLGAVLPNQNEKGA